MRLLRHGPVLGLLVSLVGAPSQGQDRLPDLGQRRAQGSGAGAAAVDAVRLTILHVNDWHGQIRPRSFVQRPGVTRQLGGYHALADYVRGVRAVARRGTALWLTDGGDWFQGTPEGNEDRGRSMIACRNRLGFTAVAVGNHEYDFGEANLIDLISRANHPVLGANIVERADPTRLRPYVRAFHVERIGGLRVALVGLVASDTKNVSTGPFGDAGFLEEVAALRRLWPELLRRADEVVLITHCGFDKDRELARQFPKLRLILGGHSHTALRTGFLDGDTWIVQSAGRTSAISRIDLAIDRRRRRLVVERVGLVPLDSKRALEDPATKRFLAATFAHIGPKWDQPVGVVRGARDRRARGSTASTPAGNYVADLIRRAANADVGVMNKGGIRSVLAHGAITRRQIFQLLPFDNTVFVADLTGAQLRKLLAEGLRSGCQPLEVGGARYSFAVVDGRRELRQIEVGGAPLQAARVYQVATNSFLAGGGDGFTVFAGLAPRRVSSDYLRAIMLSELRRTGVVQLSDDRRIRLVE